VTLPDGLMLLGILMAPKSIRFLNALPRSYSFGLLMQLLSNSSGSPIPDILHLRMTFSNGQRMISGFMKLFKLFWN